MAKKRGLGRGLEALLGGAGLDPTKKVVVPTTDDSAALEALGIKPVESSFSAGLLDISRSATDSEEEASITEVGPPPLLDTFPNSLKSSVDHLSDTPINKPVSGSVDEVATKQVLDKTERPNALSSSQPSSDQIAVAGSLSTTQKKALESPTPMVPERSSHHSDLKYIPVEFLKRGKFQPRRDFDPQALEELAQSIKEQGLMQPLVVRSVDAGDYEIIAGERRWRASQLAGLGSVPCLIRQVDDESALAMALVENMQREDLNPLEEALGLHRLHQDFDLTHQKIAQVVGKSRSTVTNLMRLTHLESEVKILLERGDLDMGHARALLTLPSGLQIQAAKTCAAKGLSVRQLETLVKSLLAENSINKKNSSKRADPNIIKLQSTLAETLGAKVAIQHAASGKGRLVIQYTTLSELEGILDHIK